MLFLSIFCLVLISGCATTLKTEVDSFTGASITRMSGPETLDDTNLGSVGLTAMRYDYKDKPTEYEFSGFYRSADFGKILKIKKGDSLQFMADGKIIKLKSVDGGSKPEKIPGGFSPNYISKAAYDQKMTSKQFEKIATSESLKIQIHTVQGVPVSGVASDKLGKSLYDLYAKDNLNPLPRPKRAVIKKMRDKRNSSKKAIKESKASKETP